MVESQVWTVRTADLTDCRVNWVLINKVSTKLSVVGRVFIDLGAMF